MEHRLQLAEGLEAPFAVICADAARADAAERLALLDEVEQAVVDGHAAGDGFAEHALALRRVAAEP